MEYIKVSKSAEKWGISPRRVRTLCAEGKKIKFDSIYRLESDLFLALGLDE